MEPDFEILTRLQKDLKEASKVLNPGEARYLVDLYYIVQEYRKGADNQARGNEEPNELLVWFGGQHKLLEQNIKRTLDIYTSSHPVGIWAKSIMGIGPVIAAGLLAHIDITKAPTVGAIWKFAGLDPSSKWEKGQKRPWNARLKVLCWKIGESFVKVSTNPKDFYGKVYVARKELETSQNEAGVYKEQAEHVLETKRIGKSTIAYGWYMKGKLPPGHIHARAKRYAVKLFLSHLFEVWYREEYNKEAPKPYCFEHLGHVHRIAAP